MTGTWASGLRCRCAPTTGMAVDGEATAPSPSTKAPMQRVKGGGSPAAARAVETRASSPESEEVTGTWASGLRCRCAPTTGMAVDGEATAPSPSTKAPMQRVKGGGSPAAARAVEMRASSAASKGTPTIEFTTIGFSQPPCTSRCELGSGKVDASHTFLSLVNVPRVHWTCLGCLHFLHRYLIRP